MQTSGDGAGARPRPLAGVIAVDLSEVVAGPIAGRMLADLGATVIKVERPEGDKTRSVMPERNGQSVYYAQMNAGKRNIVVDLREPDGAAIVAALAGRADVLLENFRPGVLAKYGLDAVTLRAAHPGLVYCSISGWGQRGVWSHRRGYAPLIHAETGYLELASRLRGRPAQQEVHVVADLDTGFFALSAILAALYQRRVTGDGQHLDVSMAEVFAYADDWAAVDLTGHGTERTFDIWNHPVVTLGDGTRATLVANQYRSLDTLLDALGAPPSTDARLATPESRHQHGELVDTVLAAASVRIANYEELEARFEARGMMCARVRSTAELAQTPWARERQTFTDVEPGVAVVRSPWRSDGAEIAVTGPPPRFGEHTDAILADLGYSPTQIADFRARKIIA